MNEAEVRAYGLIAQAIAKHAFAMAEDQNKEDGYRFPNATRPIYCHLATSTFEAVARDLWRLGILRPLDQKGDWAFHFVFDCEISRSNILAERNWPHGPTLFELLVTFINLFGDFGTQYWGFSTKPNILFGTNSRITPTLEALVTLGYLEKTDGGYLWTELIAPIMYASYEADGWSDQAER